MKYEQLRKHLLKRCSYCRKREGKGVKKLYWDPIISKWFCKSCKRSGRLNWSHTKIEMKHSEFMRARKVRRDPILDYRNSLGYWW